jgi:hypothetical protein
MDSLLCVIVRHGVTDLRYFVNFGAFHAIAVGLEDGFEVEFLDTEGAADLGVEAADYSVGLEAGKQVADFLNELFIAAEIDGTAMAVFKISEVIIWTMPVFSPSGHKRTLFCKKYRIGKDLRLNICKVGGINLIPFF